MTRTEIIAALEAATGPSRELDMAVFTLVRGWSYPLCGAALNEFDDLTREHGRTNFTSSIDAALTLVPEGFSVHMNWGAHMGYSASYLCPEGSDNGGVADPRTTNGKAPLGQPAIALCIAALRAMGGEE